SADAFDASWYGTLERQTPGGEWRFALSANRLDAAKMDRWLNPQRRISFLDRLLPFLASKPEPQPIPGWLRGRGSVSFGEFAIAPFSLSQFTADAVVDGRKVDLSNAQAEFYGGKLLGSIALNLSAQPTYDVTAQFQGVNLGLLSAPTLSLSELFAGTASGNLQMSATGIGRTALLQSLACRGDAQIRDAKYEGIDLDESLGAGARRPGSTRFPAASTDFSCADGQIRFAKMHLKSQNASYDAAGYVDFKRQMNFEFRPLPSGNIGGLVTAKDPPKESPVGTFALTGALKSPALIHIARRASGH
ncbi:MAG TPA: AsmA-like C-terminal region-containing protein, partial [Candidatus Dormibacteraeota bacterium]|nr:AsmA-like C-terminal region-containing protein [Candidatus Dormibacteraeota bacterium]